MLRALAATLIVVATGCALNESPPATSSVRVSWGGQDGSLFSDYGGSTRSGPAKPCPNWGSIDGPVTAVVAHVVVGGYAADETFECGPGNATIAVPAGSGSITFEEALAAQGLLVGDARWDHALVLVDDQVTDIGFLDLDEPLVHSSGGGGCGDDCGGGDGLPF